MYIYILPSHRKGEIVCKYNLGKSKIYIHRYYIKSCIGTVCFHINVYSSEKRYHYAPLGPPIWFSFISSVM